MIFCLIFHYFFNFLMDVLWYRKCVENPKKKRRSLKNVKNFANKFFIKMQTSNASLSPTSWIVFRYLIKTCSYCWVKLLVLVEKDSLFYFQSVDKIGNIRYKYLFYTLFKGNAMYPKQVVQAGKLGHVNVRYVK